MKNSFLSLIILCSFTPFAFSQQNESNFNLMGKWIVYNVRSDDYREPEITVEEIKFRLNRIAIFEHNALYDYIYPDQADTCKFPLYIYNKVPAIQFFKKSIGSLISSYDRDSLSCKWAGFNYTDSILVISTQCEAPFDKILTLKNGSIIVSFDGFYLYLKKEASRTR